MAPETTPPAGATRYLQTALGLLSYSQLAPLLAERVLSVERDIASRAFAAQDRFSELLLDLHQRIAGDLCPDCARHKPAGVIRAAEQSGVREQCCIFLPKTAFIRRMRVKQMR